MRVTSLQIADFRSFAKMDPIELDSINVFVGANNVGKSSLLRSLHLLQVGANSGPSDIRVGSTKSTIRIGLLDTTKSGFWSQQGSSTNVGSIEVSIEAGALRLEYKGSSMGSVVVNPIQSIEPHHFVIPYLSSRKGNTYADQVTLSETLGVSPSLANLAAKVARASNPGFPHHQAYADACRDILGFLVTAIPTANGQRAGAYLPNGTALPIDQMGDGIPHIVGLLTSLAISNQKLFLIEELENDLHPKALKALLDLIVQRAESNQFVISTHSNVVVRHLGSSSRCRVFKLSTKDNQWPSEATVQQIEPTAQARLEVLRELGYSFSLMSLDVV